MWVIVIGGVWVTLMLMMVVSFSLGVVDSVSPCQEHRRQRVLGGASPLATVLRTPVLSSAQLLHVGVLSQNASILLKVNI